MSIRAMCDLQEWNEMSWCEMSVVARMDLIFGSYGGMRGNEFCIIVCVEGISFEA